MEKEITVISIFGGSGVGKSTLAKALESSHPNMFTRVPTDFYLTARLSLSGKVRGYNWDLLQEHLAFPLRSKIDVPGFDFDTWESIPSNGWQYEIRPYMLTDAMKPYPQADYFIRIDLPNEIRRQRIVERDVRNNSNVIQDWDLHNQILEKIKDHPADLVLDGNKFIDELVGEVLKFLSP